MNRSSPSPANISYQIRSLKMRQQHLKDSLVISNNELQQDQENLKKIITERHDRIIAANKQMIEEVHGRTDEVKKSMEQNSELIKDMQSFVRESKNVMVEMQKEIKSLMQHSSTPKCPLRQAPFQTGNNERIYIDLATIHDTSSGTMRSYQQPRNVSSEFQLSGDALTESQVPYIVTERFPNSGPYQNIGNQTEEYQQPGIPTPYYQQPGIPTPFYQQPGIPTPYYQNQGTLTSNHPVPGLFATQFPANFTQPQLENTTQQKLGRFEKKNQSLKLRQQSIPSSHGINKPMHGAQSPEPSARVNKTPQPLLDNVLDKVKQEMKPIEEKQEEQKERGKVLQAHMEEFLRSQREIQEKLKEQTEQKRIEQIQKEQKELIKQKDVLIKEREHARKLEIKQIKLEEELARKQMEDNRKMEQMEKEIIQLKLKEETHKKEQMENLQRQIKQMEDIKQKEETQQREQEQLKLLETMCREQMEQQEKIDLIQKELEDVKLKKESTQRLLMELKQRQLKQREDMHQREKTQEKVQMKVLETSCRNYNQRSYRLSPNYTTPSGRPIIKPSKFIISSHGSMVNSRFSSQTGALNSTVKFDETYGGSIVNKCDPDSTKSIYPCEIHAEPEDENVLNSENYTERFNREEDEYDIFRNEDSSSEISSDLPSKDFDINKGPPYYEGMVFISKALTPLPQSDTRFFDKFEPTEDTQVHSSTGIQASNVKVSSYLLETEKNEQNFSTDLQSQNDGITRKDVNRQTMKQDECFKID